MGYHTIHYNQQGEPYIVQKNFGHDLKDDASSSHWTWHITPRGIDYLSRNQFGQPQTLPKFLHDDDLERLKTYNLLRRSDGRAVTANTTCSQPPKPKELKKTAQGKQSSGSSKEAQVKNKEGQVTRTVVSPKPVRPKKPPKPKRRVSPMQPTHPSHSPKEVPASRKWGLWDWIKSLLGEK